MSEKNSVTTQVKKPRIELFITPVGIVEESLKGHQVVVIDVLRAATSIVTALSNGARGVIPASSVAAAIELSGQLGRNDAMLCGERDGKIVEGFDIGNSPVEYTRERVRGRTLIFGSTNGSPAIVKASHAQSVFVCGFINLDAVIKTVTEREDPFPITILCAGKKGRFCLEDTVCGGLLIKRLRLQLKDDFQLNDAARSAELLAMEFGSDPLELLNMADHGQFLIEIGMESDLPVCASDSTLAIVPTLTDGKLIKYEAST